MQSVPITTNVVTLNPAQARCRVFNTTLFDKVCQWLAAGRWFSPGTLVSSTSKPDGHDITEIFLKATLNINWSVFCLSFHYLDSHMTDLPVALVTNNTNLDTDSGGNCPFSTGDTDESILIVTLFVSVVF